VKTWKTARGSAWNSRLRKCRSASRENDVPDQDNYCYGFRVVIKDKP
jgi:formylglycine-generating enzyme required for sulfatase activity